MDATMTHAYPSADAPELSPGQRYGLLAVAVVAALLGLTTLDVGDAQAMKRRHAADERTLECIVASALFAGATPAQEP